MREPIVCSCQGAVENCSRCSGSGHFIPPDPSSGVFARSKPPTAPPRPKKIWSKTFAQAAEEAAQERQIREQAHRRAVERRLFANQQLKCPICGTLLPRWQMGRHGEKRHRNRGFRIQDCAVVQPRGIPTAQDTTMQKALNEQKSRDVPGHLATLLRPYGRDSRDGISGPRGRSLRLALSPRRLWRRFFRLVGP